MSLLPGYCQYEGCESPREGTTDYCSSHNKGLRDIARDLAKPVKQVKPLRKVSTQRQPELDQYNREAARWKHGRNCLMCDWEGIKKPCDHVHHAQGREGHLLLDKTKWIPLCAKHHIWVTEHSKEAIELGISLPRNSNHIQS